MRVLQIPGRGCGFLLKLRNAFVKCFAFDSLIFLLKLGNAFEKCFAFDSMAFLLKVRNAFEKCFAFDSLIFLLKLRNAFEKCFAFDSLIFLLKLGNAFEKCFAFFSCVASPHIKITKKSLSRASTDKLFSLLYAFLSLSRIRESNPPPRLGKPMYYRCTNPALFRTAISFRGANPALLQIVMPLFGLLFRLSLSW